MQHHEVRVRTEFLAEENGYGGGWWKVTGSSAPAHAMVAQHDRVDVGIELLLYHRRPLLLPVRRKQH